MRKTAIMSFVLAALFASPANGTEMAGILQTNSYTISIDSVNWDILPFPRMDRTPGWQAAPGAEDTVQFATMPGALPRAATLYYHFDSAATKTKVIPLFSVDVWYDLPYSPTVESTNARVMFRDTLLVGIKDGQGLSRPVDVVVTPNPSRDRALFSFQTAGTCRSRVEVVDLAGRPVSLLFDGIIPAGRHEFLWTGRDHRGKRVSAGVYLARLSAGPQQTVLKLVLTD
jgi:hypothetical protein